MKKTYTSRNTTPHFSIGDRRVTFIPMSKGGSYYETEDKEEMERIERHPWYGSLFRLHRVEDDDARTGETPQGTESDTGDDVGEPSRATPVEEVSAEPETMCFDTLADAKNYLASEFDVVRSNVKNTATAVSIGRSHGVELHIGNRVTT